MKTSFIIKISVLLLCSTFVPSPAFSKIITQEELSGRARNELAIQIQHETPEQQMERETTIFATDDKLTRMSKMLERTFFQEEQKKLKKLEIERQQAEIDRLKAETAWFRNKQGT